MKLEALKAENQTLKKEVQQLSKQYDILSEKLAATQFQIQQLQKLIFSARSERHIPKTANPEQLAFDFGELAPTDLEPNADLKEEKIKVEYERRKKINVGRHPLPEHLRVEEIRIEVEGLPEDAEQNGYLHIADTIVETLEYTPGSLFKKRIYSAPLRQN